MLLFSFSYVNHSTLSFLFFYTFKLDHNNKDSIFSYSLYQKQIVFIQN